ncbi:MAG TPA: hypothetical protein VJZ69_00805 [Clostridia bacterium]|nr:hypothetical protein [Clostridia bacterium]
MEIKKPEMGEKTRGRLNELYIMLQERNYKKAEIMAYFGVGERTAREMISIVSKRAPVIAVSNTRGYRIAKSAEDIDAVMHSWKEIDSRQKELEERKIPLIKFYEKQKEKMV